MNQVRNRLKIAFAATALASSLGVSSASAAETVTTVTGRIASIKINARKHSSAVVVALEGAPVLCALGSTNSRAAWLPTEVPNAQHILALMTSAKLAGRSIRLTTVVSATDAKYCYVDSVELL